MSALSSADEQVMLLSAKEASAATVDGVDPTEAVIKIARDRKLKPGEIKLVCAALNNGRQTAQMRANKSAMDKFAAFPLANADEVIKALYAQEPCEFKTAEVIAPVVREKAASATEPVILTRKRDDIDELYTLRRQADEASRRANETRDKAASAIVSLVTYFEKSAYDRMDFATFDAGVKAYLSPQAVRAVDLLASRFPAESRCGASLRTKCAIDLNAEPFRLLDVAVSTAAEANEAAKANVKASAALDAHEQDKTPTLARTAPKKQVLAGDLKSVATFAALTPIFQGVQARLRPEKTPTPDDVAQSMRSDLEDPQHEDELRRIRARVMLNGLLSDPEDSVSGHSPEEVASAYNELAQVAPRASELPAVMAPLLRRRLGGGFEPFESKELIDIEKGLSAVRPDTTSQARPPNVASEDK